MRPAPSHWPVERFEHSKTGVDRAGDMPVVRPHEHVTAAELVVGDAGEVERRGCRGRLRAVGVLTLQRPHSDGGVLRQHGQLVLDPHHPAGERSGDDRAGALGREHAIDPQARLLVIPCRGSDVEEVIERGGEVVDAVPVDRVDRPDGGVGPEGALGPVGDLHLGDRGQFIVDVADLGQRDDAVADAEQAEDAKVLLALGFPALGCGDDEDACVDTADAGEHVLEADVAGHVDERDATTRW